MIEVVVSISTDAGAAFRIEVEDPLARGDALLNCAASAAAAAVQSHPRLAESGVVTDR